MNQQISESLQIVGEELAVTLNDARLALEQFAEGEGGPNILERCVRLLHTARGVLRMTETHGASLLAEEMEETCRHISHHRGQDGSDEALEALSRAAVQLPAYVERILNGGRDIPLVLLPLLNDLRAARGKPLLSESTLLLLNVFTPQEESVAIEREHSGEDLRQLCQQLRPRFQLALLGWIKGTDASRNLRHLGEIAGRLEAAASAPEIYRLWWVTAGVIEALLGGSLETSVSLKRLMGQVDREMKRLIGIGEEACAAQPARELINNLLYYIARAGDTGQRVPAIRAAFQLADMVPGDSQVEAVRESLAAPSVKLMQTVAEAIREDLARVKDVLDIYVRTGMEHAEELIPQVELLKKIGDTLGVLGLGELREVIQARRADLAAITAGEVEASESGLVNMAAELLAVEHRLDDQLLRLIAPKEDGALRRNRDDEDVDYAEVSRAVMHECVVNLARVKDAVTQVLERPGEGAALLDSVPPLLRGVTAGLLILEKVEAVEVVEGIDAAIRELIQQGYAVDDRPRVDLLADAIVSLDYYLETLEAGRREPTYMLENALRCLAALREASFPMPAVTSPASSGMATTLALEEPSATVEALDPRALASIPGLAATIERPDPEIIELFIEEAGEEIEAIRRNFPAWQENTADSAALAALRRSFHTLKGSGRMVGAALIGEFSWSFENLLNRIINQTLEKTPELFELLGEAVDALPQLLEHLEVGTAPSADVAGLIARAEALSTGGVAPAAEPRIAPEPTTQEPVAAAPEPDAESLAGREPAPVPEPEEVAVGLGIDPVLLDILEKEVGGHLSAVREFVAECRHGTPPFPVPETLYRACHTLHGSVTMAKADAAAALTGPLNRLIRHAYDHGVPVGPDVLDACDAAVNLLEKIMVAFAEPAPEFPDTGEVAGRLALLDDAIERAAAAAQAEAEEATQAMPAITLDETPVPPEEIAAPVPEFDPEIAAIFAEEAAEILESTDGALERLAGGEPEALILEEIQRYLHTLKGGARMAGLSAVGDLSHDLEALLIGINSSRLQLDAPARELVRGVVDRLHGMRDEVAAGSAPRAANDLLGQLQRALRGETWIEAPAESVEAQAPVADVVTPVDEAVEAQPPETEPGEAEVEAASAGDMTLPAETMPSAEDEEPSAATLPAIPALEHIGQLARELEAPAQPAAADLGGLAAAASREPVIPERRQYARVDPELLEQLLNNAGEISIFHSRLSQQMSQIQFNVEELGQTVVRLRDQLRSLELATEAQILYLHQADIAKNEQFDPLELDRYSRIQQLSRALAETASDVNSLKELLKNLTGDTEALLLQQSRTTTELQDGLMRTRMVPFQGHAARLARLVRQTAQEYGKQAELSLRGGGELDRQVLEKMLPPFEHMLRNAVIHGIESPAQREAAGKPSVGTVVISLRREGSEVVIEVSDDGRGLDVTGIRRKAEQLGLLDGGVEVTDEEAMQFILRSGFSTAEKLTQSAGRGIGMDVVASEITKLGGTLRIDSRSGTGTRFTVRLPFTLAVTQALIVRAGQELFALPLPTVEGIVRISRQECDARMAEADPAIDYAGQRYHFRHLGQFLGTGPSRIADDQDRLSIILVRAGENSTALITDEMLDSREIVVKPVGDQLASIRGISGATILGDGRVVIILDVGALVRSSRPALEPLAPVVETRSAQPLALVVDDSITMRRVTQRLLERNNFEVLTAKDGVEAIGILQEHLPDIILLDVEMPRMDGYEFATHVRNNPETESLPIIMITSRVSDKHRARAIELGVNDYLGKPYQEQELMDAVHHLLGMVLE